MRRLVLIVMTVALLSLFSTAALAACSNLSGGALLRCWEQESMNSRQEQFNRQMQQSLELLQQQRDQDRYQDRLMRILPLLLELKRRQDQKMERYEEWYEEWKKRQAELEEKHKGQ